MYVFTVIFDQFNVSLQNKSINFLKNSTDLKIWMLVEFGVINTYLKQNKNITLLIPKKKTHKAI